MGAKLVGDTDKAISLNPNSLLHSARRTTQGGRTYQCKFGPTNRKPEKFDGKLIRVIGFLRLEFEGNVLYLHREDYENAIFENGIWVQVTPQIKNDTKTINMHYVIMQGIFSAKDHGHMGMFGGALKNTRRSELLNIHHNNTKNPE